jgi:hypothetical protein
MNRARILRAKGVAKLLLGIWALCWIVFPALGTVLIDEKFEAGYNRTSVSIAGQNMAWYKGDSDITATVTVGSVSFSATNNAGDSAFWTYFTDSGANISGIGKASSVNNGHLLLGVGDELNVSVSFLFSNVLDGTSISTNQLRFGIFDDVGTRQAADENGGPFSNAFTNNPAFGTFVPLTSDVGSNNLISLRRRTNLSDDNPLSTQNDWTQIEGLVGGTYLPLAGGSNYTFKMSIARPNGTDYRLSASIIDTLTAQVMTSGSVTTNGGWSSFDWFMWHMLAMPTTDLGGPYTFTRLKVEVVGLFTNSWVAGDGKWETGSNWETGAPNSGDLADLITNAVTKTVTIDSTTVSSSSIMRINDLTISAPAATVNTLQLTNAGTATPLRILNGLTISSGGALLLTNSALLVGGESGRDFIVDGTVSNRAGGQMFATNATTIVGNLAGSLGGLSLVGGTSTLSNGLIVGALSGSTGNVTLTAGRLDVASGGVVIGSNGVGMVTQTAGTNQFVGVLIVGFNSLANGTLSVSGGQLVVTNNVNIIGRGGPGRFIQTGGLALMPNVVVGRDSTGQGMFTVSGGTNQMSGALTIAQNAGSDGALWLTGGRLVTTNAVSCIGSNGVGQLTASNGIWLATNVTVAANAGSQGTLTVAGGTNTVSSSLILGNFGCSSTGTVIVAGGRLFVTNAAANAVLEVRSGTVTLNSGTLTINALVITNACAHFVQTGGTLGFVTLNLSPNFDADGDGIPNASDLNPLNPTDAGKDPDGDGFTNLQEFQAGTDPTNSASFFGITAIVKTNDDIRVTWMTGVGMTNALERSTGTPDGSYSNNFAAIFTVTNTTGTSTNYLDTGAATNVPSFYYRVRLVP